MTDQRRTRPSQLARDDLTGMTPEEIVAAQAAGRLDDVLGITRHHPPRDGQWTAADLTAMYGERRYDEIDRARAAGQLRNLLTGDDATN